MKILVIPCLTLVLTVVGAWAQAVPIRAQPDKGCPNGYTQSGSYCTPTSANVRQAIPKRPGDVCPSGYYQSGSACVSAR